MAGYATREVRVFDGAVVSDTKFAPAGSAASEAQPDAAAGTAAQPETPSSQPAKSEKFRTVRNGITLGRAMFSATPKLSLFLCLLMLLGSLGLLTITGRCGKVPELLGAPTMFAPTEGRLVVTKSDGSPLSDKEVEDLAEETGAVRTLHYDYLLDAFQGEIGTNTYLPGGDTAYGLQYGLQPVYGEHFREKMYGREPREENEALLYLPVSYRPDFGSGDDFVRRISWFYLEFEVTGVQYYVDNNKTPKILLTEEGFACALAANLLAEASQSVRVGFTADGKMIGTQELQMILPSFEMPADKLYVSSRSFTEALDQRTAQGAVPYAQITLDVYFRINNSFLNQFLSRSQKAFSGQLELPGDLYLREKPEDVGSVYSWPGTADRPYLAVNINSVRKVMEEELAGMYPQASLFYASEKKAQAAADTLRKDGYISSLSTAKYSPEAYETVLNSAQGIMLLALWVLTVVFLAFFINLCSGKAVGAFRHDLAILRSMGISVRTVVAGLFTRLYLSLLPSVIFVLVLAFVLFRTPKGNAAFPYLYPWQYLLIFLGMALMATRVGYKQVKKLFGRSVREALRGGEDA